jgi:hypothetical protein
MTNREEAYRSLNEMLRLTRDEELDCDRFLELLAPFVDGRVDDPHLQELIQHHRHLCTECGEQLAILERALSAGPTDRGAV